MTWLRFSGLCRKVSWALCPVKLASNRLQAAWQEVSVDSSRQSPQEWRSLPLFICQDVKHIFHFHIWTKKKIVFRFIVILPCNRGNCSNLINICDMVCSVFEPLEPGKLQQTCAESFVVTGLCFARLTEIICLHFFFYKSVEGKDLCEYNLTYPEFCSCNNNYKWYLPFTFLHLHLQLQWFASLKTTPLLVFFFLFLLVYL